MSGARVEGAAIQHRRVDDVDEVRAGEEIELGGQPVGVPDRKHADEDYGQLQEDVGQRQPGKRPLARAAADVADVEQAGGDDHRARHRHLPARLAEIG